MTDDTHVTHTPMAMYARTMDLDGPGGDFFSAACALHWYCVNYHGGQWSDLYRIQCQLEYQPGHSEHGPDPESTDALIYADLESGELDPADVLAWIEINQAAHREQEG